MATDARLHYHPMIKALHWLVAVLVFAVWPLGFLQFLVAHEVYGDINFWHVSLGFLIFWLMLARLCVRFLSTAPGRLEGTPGWAAGLARLNHWLLYLALICQPVLGWLTTNAQGFPLDWFGVIPIWDPIGKSAAAHTLLTAHTWLAWLILALVGLHICGTLYHRVIRRDQALARIS